MMGVLANGLSHALWSQRAKGMHQAVNPQIINAAATVVPMVSADMPVYREAAIVMSYVTTEAT